MSRSLAFAFLMALILHSLLAWVELDVFKKPVHGKRPLRALNIDIVRPRPLKKASAAQKTSVAAKEPLVKKKTEKRIKPKQRITPKITPEKKMLPERAMRTEKPSTKPQTVTLDPLPQGYLSEFEGGEAIGSNNSDALDLMTDTHMVIAAIKEAPQAVREEDLPDSFSNAPLVIALPLHRKNTPPPYPRLARRRGYEGMVLLEVLVGEDGKVGSIKLYRSSGYKSLDRAALKGVKNWLFQPGRKGVKPVEMWVKIPVRFQLK